VLGLVALGAVLAWYGWIIVDNIWGEGDSSAEAYLMFGLPLIVLGLCCLAGAALVVRRR
jgi:TRAP-type C4-dicarboxylate transport system permease small subunit